ncbi:MAG: M50 family metallopeptidase [Anaerolineae bacterium]|nr:M50 family metallopeptidase [Anaerolineae bacterium]
MFNVLISIIEFVIVIGLLAFLHEFGHFIIARLFKIEIEEFGFGLPPRIVKLFTFQNTEVTLNWIPFGAFVRPKGENNPDIPGGLASASPWARISVLLGGPVMNLITGILLFSLLFQQLGIPDPHSVKVMVVSENSPAQQAGLLAGDIITGINGETISGSDQLISLVKANLEKSITITYQRDGNTVTTNAVPRSNPPAGQGALGIQMGYSSMKINFGQAAIYSVGAVGEITRQMVLLPYHLIQGQVTPEQARVVGPKGMYDMYEQARSTDEQQNTATHSEELPFNTIYLVALISVAMGLTNLLPIPALDGGRILFVLPELILRRRVPPEYENFVHFVGFAMLIMLMILITAQDFINPIVVP